ncbi:MAG: hypothetical protein JW814_06815 [Candidatus Krumholzibacteriota bacterium]|nr:hypothetical protein [Candidatus Krumholzibacteriota bacterium]
MKKFIPLALLAGLAVIFLFHGCNTDQSTNVIVEGGGDPDGNIITVHDTIYIDDCPPSVPDTVYAGDCPDCPDCPDDPDCPDCPDCPACESENAYEGFFLITGMMAAQVTESCQYSWIATTLQAVSIEGGVICFAGWTVEWNDATHVGHTAFEDYFESDGIWYDTTMDFNISFSGTDNLTAVLTYHLEAGYVGSAAAYACDDQFTVTAERVTASEASRVGTINRKMLPVPSIGKYIFSQ